MQLSYLDKLNKISSTRWVVQDKQRNQKYILTQMSPSEYDKQLLTLNHPNLLMITDCWEEKGFYNHLQPYTELLSLQELMPLKEQHILQIVFQLANALQYLEQCKMNHTVTLKNIFFDGCMKIDIFGLKNPPIVYASPEILRKECTYSGAWSLGCIIYYMVKRVLPFQSETEKITAYNIIYKDYNLPNEQIVCAPLVKSLLSKNLRKRASYQQVMNFVQGHIVRNDLQDIVSGRIAKKYSMQSLDFKESQIECIDQSASQPMLAELEKQEKIVKPEVPKIITLDDFDTTKFRINKERPQSSLAPKQLNLFERLSKMRPNSAVGLTGKQFIASAIKLEMNNRRLLHSATQNEVQKAKQQNEISVDLKDSHRVKNGDFIRVYNLESDAKQQPKKTQLYLKVLQQNSPKASNCPKHIQVHLDNWKNKMTINQFKQ